MGYLPGDEALSVLGAGHSHAERVVDLLTAARFSIEADEFVPCAAEPVGSDIALYAPVDRDPRDATNYLGGIADVLEDKSYRGSLGHLGELRRVSVYRNDRQIKQVTYH